MPLTLLHTPGFADVPDIALAAEAPSYALNLNRIALNANLGMIRPEIFSGFYLHGAQVPLPESPVDGYVYSRSELMYAWGIQSTLNQSTHWVTGPDSLWYCTWIVDQATGNVESIEYYRRSGSHDNAQQSNDGLLQVFTIAQRGSDTMSLAHPANTWTDLPNADFATDAALGQTIAQTLNRNAKFAIVGTEAIYMGEFKNGDTIPQPVSPADGYTYAYSQVKFRTSWRWTTYNSSFTQPDKSLGQLGPMKASVNPSSGVVSVSIQYIDNSGALVTHTDHGRIMVIAFCSRQNLIGTLTPTANEFAEIDSETLMPGNKLRASTLLQLQKNIREAVCTSEFFGPTSYHNGNTVPLPVSPIDGYHYTRDEITPVWDWDDTTNQTGTHLRAAAFWATVDQSTGLVTLHMWRLPPGGPYVEDGDAFATVNVTVVANRGAQHAALPPPASPGVPTDAGTAVVDNNPPDIAPYAVPYYAGQSAQPIASEILLRHPIPGDVASVTFPASLTGSYGGCITAPTGAIVITLKKGSTTIGTLNIAAGATTMTFSFLAAITFSPGDLFDFVFQSSLDATLAGLYWILAGTRT